MRLQPFHLNTQEKQVFNRTRSMLEKGLDNLELLHWAIGLKPSNIGEREAVLFILDNPNTPNLKEPWHTAWGLVAESFKSNISRAGRHHGSDHFIAEKITEKDVPKYLVVEVCEYVTPWLEVKEVSSLYRNKVKTKQIQRDLHDLIYASMESHSFPETLNGVLQKCDDSAFILSLVHHLHQTIRAAFNLGRRIGWDEKSNWRLGSIKRVYFMEGNDSEGRPSDPDEYHHGIAPSIKLFYTTLSRLAEIDPNKAQTILSEIQTSAVSIERRLWAALARSNSIAAGDVVFEFVNHLSADEFWEAVNEQPEYLELLAIRFGDMSLDNQAFLIARILKGPPRRFWKDKNLSDLEFQKIKNYWITREFKRLLLGSKKVPSIVSEWLETNLNLFPNLAEMDSVDFDFSKRSTARWVPSQPDQSFNSISGEKRLEALERSFSAHQSADENSGNALDWLLLEGNIDSVLTDLETQEVNASDFPLTLDKLGDTIRPNSAPSENTKTGERIFKITSELSKECYRVAHRGLSAWLYKWTDQIKTERKFFDVWLSLWSAASSEYNSRKVSKNADNHSEDFENWMITTAIWDLTTVFVKLCPDLKDKPKPFQSGILRKMRNALDASDGEVREISDYILLRSISYYFSADKKWTKVRLVSVLLEEENDSSWEGLSRTNFLSPAILNILGEKLVDKATDDNLRRDVRKNFAARLIIDVIHAYREDEDTSVPSGLVTRMLRKTDDEVRIHAADQLVRFFRYWTGKSVNEEPPASKVWSPEKFWMDVINPILIKVWPKDAYLITPGMSDAFANLPVLSGDCFSSAVDEIDKYLMPFNCWAMHDFGFDFQRKDKLIDVVTDSEKAKALLKLLDRSIGTDEDAVVPYDLSAALEHIAVIDNKLIKLPSFKRLKAQIR